MSIRPILRWPDPRLAQVCAPVEDPAEVSGLAADLLDTMYDAKGRGLAASQVGEMLRLFVTDVTWKEGRRDPRVFINPAIVERAGGMSVATEVCLSIPGVEARVARPARVRLAWTDEAGAARDQWFEGPAAVCVQHELDHLDGIVTLDRLDDDARAEAEAAYAG